MNNHSCCNLTESDDFDTRLQIPFYGMNEANCSLRKSGMDDSNQKVISKLKKVSLMCTTFMTIEFFGGWFAGSLAIMTDAAHLLSDLAGFLISMMSLYIALRPANFQLTYGYHRAEVIGALSSILIIWILTAWLLSEAVYRINHPQPIMGLVMTAIAACGLMFNLIMSKILTRDPIPNAFEAPTLGIEQFPTKGVEMNSVPSNQPLIDKQNESDNPVLRAAYIHILGDIIQSVGVLMAASIIYFFQTTVPGITLVDPVCTFVFAIIVLSTSIPVSKDCIAVLMEATPKDVEIKKLIHELKEVTGVVNIHDLHIWCISIGKFSISLHILSNTPQKTLEIATQVCKKYKIHHSTIQVEDNSQNQRPSFINCTHIFDNSIH